ncbi:MAG: N-6 DNA methylase [Patescibacteria group bacterium]
MIKDDFLLNEFEKLTIDYINSANLDYRKSKGQYFTPKSIREELLRKLPINQKKIKILDPACGTGEFLLSASKFFNKAELYGWDIDKKLIEISSKISPKAKLELTDSLTKNVKEKFDIVIGNPPYFEFQPSEDIKNRYKEVLNGRTNIFNLFIKLGLDLVKKNGYVAYVVPPSMNNGAYFNKLREYIIKHSNIESLSILKSPKLFHGAQQTVMLLILKKTKNKQDYIFKKNGITIFTERPNHLLNAFKGKKTLKELNYSVKTGRLVWNQNKDLLTNDPEAGTLLIWAKNITSTGLKLHLKDKFQYVKSDNHDIGPAIVVNRIVGSIGNSQLKAAMISEGVRFIAENHVNVIYPPDKNEQLNFILANGKNSNISLEEITSQLNSKEKIDLLQYLTGNTQISKNELEKLFPLDM